MVIGVLDVRLALRGSRSLKDKRRVVNSLKDRVRNKWNVSVAEVDSQDMLQVAELGIAQVSGDARYVRASLEKVAQMIRRFRPAQLTDYRIEVFHQ
jgi:hypothetical protein